MNRTPIPPLNNGIGTRLDNSMINDGSDMPNSEMDRDTPDQEMDDDRDTAGGNADSVAPFVQEHDGNRSLHFSATEIQSRMSLLAPDALDLEYTRMMMGFLMFNPQVERIAMIGLGGGSLAKFCHRHLTKTAIDVVEINPDVIALRDAFHIPPESGRFSVIEADGGDYVARASMPADVLLVDGFDIGGTPPQLCTAQFYADCFRFLRDDGIMIVNLHLNHPLHSVYLDRIRESFGSSVFDVIDDDMTNSIVFAFKGDRFEQTALDGTRRPEGLSKEAWRQLMPTFKVIAATLVAR
jgi:spermidine synthase